MKKVYLTLALSGVAALSYGQASKARVQKHDPSFLKPAPIQQAVPASAFDNVAPNLLKSNAPSSVAAVPNAEYGVPIGYTFWDQPTLGSTHKRLDRFPDGTLGAAWTYSRRGTLTGTTVTRLAAYNQRNAAGQWLYGGTAGYNAELDSLRIQAAGDSNRAVTPRVINNGNGAARGRMNDVNYMALPSNNEVIAGYGVGPAGGFFQAQAYVRAKGATTWPFIAPNDNGASVRAPFRMSRSIWGRGGNNIYVVGTSFDSTVATGAVESNTTTPLVFGRSTDNGQTWTAFNMPNISTATGLNEVSSMHGFNVVGRGNTVAVVAKFYRLHPYIGIVTVLFKSTDQGNSWSTRIIDHIERANDDRAFGLTFDPANAYTRYTYAVLGNDGAFGLAIDANDKVHVTAARGYDLADSTGELGFIYPSGGFANPVAGTLMYWSEATPDRPFRVINQMIDIDNNGTVSYPLSGASEPGDYRQSHASMSQIVVDNNNPDNLYVAYSGIVETSEQYNPTTRVTRDIYFLASTDGGETWSFPINVAGKLGNADDGATGGTSQAEETFPSLVPEVGTDNKLQMTFMTDEFAGSSDWLQRYSASTYRPTTIAYFETTTDAVFNTIIRAKFPLMLCSGQPFNVPYVLPTNGSIPAGTTLQIQIDTSAAETFAAGNTIVVGSGSAAATGTLTGTVPAALNLNAFVRIRIVAVGLSGTRPMAGPFDIAVTTGTPAALSAITAASNNVCGGASQVLETSSGNSVIFNWSLSPSTAGSISYSPGVGGGDRATVWYNPDYRGPVTISVTGENACGVSAPQSVVVNVGGPQIREIPGTDSLEVFAGFGNTYRWYYGTNFNQNLSSTRKVRKSAGDGTYTVIVDNGCRASYNTTLAAPGTLFDPTAVVPVITSILEPSLKTASNLYPNPAKDRFVVELNDWTGTQAVRATVFNQLGQLVAEQELTHENGLARAEFNTAGFGRGLYVVRLVSGTQVATKRVVIE